MPAALEAAVDRFAAHEAFERRGDRTFEQVTTPFDASITVLGPDSGLEVHLTVVLESLDATAAERVPDVVERGWFETFRRRVEDATTVTDGPDAVPEVTLGASTVTVDVALETTADRAPTDAKAVVDFVEATWVQGLVPGFEYEHPATSLLGDARQGP